MKKVKKPAIKCALCKKQARKQDIKMCRSCKRFFHFVCINMEKESAPKKYICEKCEFMAEDEVVTKQQKKAEKLRHKETERQLRLDGQFKSLWFSDHKKLDRDRRGIEYNRAFSDFSKRYSYYVKDS